MSGAQTLLFVDEVHRFSKTQQDALLLAVENRWVSFIGATTENPSFSVVSPLLSRSLLATRCRDRGRDGGGRRWSRKPERERRRRGWAATGARQRIYGAARPGAPTTEGGGGPAAMFIK